MTTRLVTLLVLACLAMVCSCSLQGEPCTPATCVGPVIAYFEYSNCTGAVTYEQYPISDLGHCFNYTADSEMIFMNDEYIEERNYANDNHCGANGGDFSFTFYRQYFGTCLVSSESTRASEEDLSSEDLFGSSRSLLSRRSTGTISSGGSYLYLSNVNASFDAPQNYVPINTDVPLFQGVLQACPSPDNCTSDGQDPFNVWDAYTNDTCSTIGSSKRVVNITSGMCYRVSSSPTTTYVRWSCIGPHSYITEYMLAECSRPVTASIFHFSCGPGYSTTLTCTVPTVPTTPSSPASSKLVASTLLVAILTTLMVLFVQ